MAKKHTFNTEDLSFDYDFLNQLVVGIGEVALITKVPVRQLRYWEEKGIIKSLTEESGKNRRYDYKNLKTILLIKELLEEGYTLESAVKKIENRMQKISDALTMLSKIKS